MTALGGLGPGALRTRSVTPAILAGGAAAVIAAVSPLVAALALAAAALAAMVALLPGVVFGLYLLIPFYKGALQVYSPIDLTIVLALANASQAIPMFLRKGPRGMDRAALILWPAFALVVLLGVSYAPDLDLAVGRAAGFVALIFVPLTCGALRVASDLRYVRQLLWTFVAIGSIVVVLGMAQLSTESRLEVLDADTINVARAALLVPILAGAYILHRRGILLRAVTVAFIPAALVVAVATGSRGPLLVFVILAMAAALGWVLRVRSFDKGTLTTISGLVLASVVIGSITLASLPPESVERFGGFQRFVETAVAGDVNASTNDTSAAARLTLFGVAMVLISEQPLFGVGTAGYAALGPRYLSPDETFAYPHNAFLQIGAEHGLVGVALFLSLVVLAFSRTLPGRESVGLRVLLLFFLANAMISGNIMEDRMIWGLLLVLLFLDQALTHGPAYDRLRSPTIESEG